MGSDLSIECESEVRLWLTRSHMLSLTPEESDQLRLEALDKILMLECCSPEEQVRLASWVIHTDRLNVSSDPTLSRALQVGIVPANRDAAQHVRRYIALFLHPTTILLNPLPASPDHPPAQPPAPGSLHRLVLAVPSRLPPDAPVLRKAAGWLAQQYNLRELTVDCNHRWTRRSWLPALLDVGDDSVGFPQLRALTLRVSCDPAALGRFLGRCAATLEVLRVEVGCHPTDCTVPRLPRLRRIRLCVLPPDLSGPPQAAAFALLRDLWQHPLDELDLIEWTGPVDLARLPRTDIPVRRLTLCGEDFVFAGGRFVPVFGSPARPAGDGTLTVDVASPWFHPEERGQRYLIPLYRDFLDHGRPGDCLRERNCTRVVWEKTRAPDGGVVDTPLPPCVGWPAIF